MYDYICTSCGTQFSSPVPDYDVSNGCPDCGEDVEKIYICSCCGAAMPEHQAKYSLCKTCEGKILDAFKQFLTALKAQYGENGITYLQDRQDGEWWKDFEEWK